MKLPTNLTLHLDRPRVDHEELVKHRALAPSGLCQPGLRSLQRHHSNSAFAVTVRRTMLVQEMRSIRGIAVSASMAGARSLCGGPA